MKTKFHHIALIACLCAAGLLGVLAISPLFSSTPYGQLVIGVIVVLMEVALPLEILKWLHLKPREFNIYAHNIDALLDLPFPPYGSLRVKPDYAGLAQELMVLSKVVLITIAPYCLAYWAIFQLKALHEGNILVVSINLPPKLWYEIIVQVFVVALPEELFYRGFLQGALRKKWPHKRSVLGIPLGISVIVTNIFFAVGHVVTTWSPWRLLTFFPGLIFSALTIKNKSILSAILYHAICNIIGLSLYSSIFTK